MYKIAVLSFGLLSIIATLEASVAPIVPGGTTLLTVPQSYGFSYSTVQHHPLTPIYRTNYVQHLPLNYGWNPLQFAHIPSAERYYYPDEQYLDSNLVPVQQFEAPIGSGILGFGNAPNTVSQIPQESSNSDDDSVTIEAN